MIKFRLRLILAMIGAIGTIALQAAPEQEFSRNDVRGHAIKTDCWIIVDSVVYDITSYMKDHLRYKYELDSWCGKESTQAWETKDGKNTAHSRKAKLMLEQYRKGKLKAS